MTPFKIALKAIFICLLLIVSQSPLSGQEDHLAKRDQRKSLSDISMRKPAAQLSIKGKIQNVQKHILTYLHRHLRYPPKAEINGLEGLVIVQGTFIGGKLDSHMVLKGIGGGCEEEVIRILQELPATVTRSLAETFDREITLNFPVHYYLQ